MMKQSNVYGGMTESGGEEIKEEEFNKLQTSMSETDHEFAKLSFGIERGLDKLIQLEDKN